MQRAQVWVAAGVLGVVLCGCSSSTGSTGSTGSSGGGSGGGSSAGAAADEPEVPLTTQDLERVCTDGLGFAGLPAYDRTKKTVHPAQLMNSTGDGWSSSVPVDGDFPKGWFLGYEDKPAQTELVVCLERTKVTATGKVCDMEADGKPLKIKTYNTSYRLRVVEARTGKEQYAHSGKAESDECPAYIFTSSDDEDADKYYNEVRPEDYRKRIKPYIAP